MGDKPGFSSEDECFPEPLRYHLTETGEISGERTEPIAGDTREGKDGKNNAKLKLLAGLLGVNFDELRQREHERRLRRARAIGAGALFLVGIFAALATWATIAAKQAAWQKRQTQRLLVASDFSRAEEHHVDRFERFDHKLTTLHTASSCSASSIMQSMRC